MPASGLRLALLTIVVFVAACAGPRPTAAPATETASPSIEAGPPGAATNSAAATPPATTSPAVEAHVVAVSLTDALRIEPATMTVPAGQPVTFVVTNVGLLNHEFFVGDAAAQANHEFEMAARHAQFAQDSTTGIAVAPGETRELTLTFPAVGESLAGCHIINHYPGGMKSTITIAP